MMSKSSVLKVGGITLGLLVGVCVVYFGIEQTRAGAGEGSRKSVTAAQTELPPVQVFVTKLVPQPGRYIYRYTVANGSAFPITNLLIGKDQERGIDEISYPPMGWDGDSVPASNFKSPPGWRFRSITVEEDSIGYLSWDILRHGEEILGGTTVGGFEVTQDVLDGAYDGGHWTVYLNSAEEPLYSGGLQPTSVTSVPVSSIFGKSDLRIDPNPSRDAVGIHFRVPVAGATDVGIYDVSGRLVRRVLDKVMSAGEASVAWDGRDNSGKEVAAGVYFVRVTTPTTKRFGRITLLR